MRRKLLGVALAGVTLLSASCQDRPVVGVGPQTTNVVVTQLQQETPSQIDLLFMIDNSESMADKQVLLANAVPALVRRLVEPRCINPATEPPLGGNFPCAQGKPEFTPVDDMHLGVITTSIGGHGATICSPAWDQWNPTQNDGAHLLGERRGLVGGEFLTWAPGASGADPTELVQEFASHVKAAGENGCGYEAPLEAWYRFLIDPEPPASVKLEGGKVALEGVDDVLLEQRADFLRPNSLVAVVMLGDENDCSIIDAGQAWFAAGDQLLPRATSACEQNPDDACCRSCGLDEAAPPAGCAAIADDPGCKVVFHDATSDDPRLRCWDQKRRFGADFLYPVERYVEALSQKRIHKRTGEEVDNPLYSDLRGTGAPVRDPGFVYLAGIVGVPWQDVATPASASGSSELAYLTAREIGTENRWSWLLPDNGAPPADALMIESDAPRTGMNPATNAALLPPDATASHPINGHEWNTDHADLQYSCIYPLAAPRDCSNVANDESCDCIGVTAGDASRNPLCQDPATGEYGHVQYFAKAYPGTRQLRVLKGFGENAIVASICPKLASGESSVPSYGYNPAADAIVDRLKEHLVAECMPRPLALNSEGTASCAVVEAISGSCSCDGGNNRAPVGGELDSAVRRRLRELGQCGGASGVACDAFCLCEIGSATDQASCQNAEAPEGVGWCYVDPARGIGSPALVADCPSNAQRIVRFVGEDTPVSGATAFVACLGAPATDAPPAP